MLTDTLMFGVFALWCALALLVSAWVIVEAGSFAAWVARRAMRYVARL